MEITLTIGLILGIMFAPFFSLLLISEFFTFYGFGLNILTLFLGVCEFLIWFHFTGKDKNFTLGNRDPINGLIDDLQ